MPRALTSLERATTQPSLPERTTTGLSLKSGRKIRSQETKKLLQSHSANIVDGVSNDAPDEEGIFLSYAYRLKTAIVRDKPRTLVGGIRAELLDGKLAIDIGSDIITIGSLQRAVNDDNISAKNTRLPHAVSVNTGIESGIGMPNDFTSNINALGVIRSRGREARVEVLRQGQFWTADTGRRDINKQVRHTT